MDRYRILVTGSRTWNDYETLAEALSSIATRVGCDDLVIVHGACHRGADRMADEWARAHSISVERHPAAWDSQGRGAGFRRNAAMVERGADVCLAFIKDKSRGATHCADLAETAGIPVRRYTP